MSRRDARPFWSVSAERQALKAQRGETRTGLDAQLATRAEHAIAVSGPRPEMPLASFALLLLLINMPPAARLRWPAIETRNPRDSRGNGQRLTADNDRIDAPGCCGWGPQQTLLLGRPSWRSRLGRR